MTMTDYVLSFFEVRVPIGENEPVLYCTFCKRIVCPVKGSHLGLMREDAERHWYIKHLADMEEANCSYLPTPGGKLAHVVVGILRSMESVSAEDVVKLLIENAGVLDEAAQEDYAPMYSYAYDIHEDWTTALTHIVKYLEARQ